MENKQCYHGYKPLECELYVAQNRMVLLRNGGFIGMVQVNNFNDCPVIMFDPEEVVINIQPEHLHFSFKDFKIIEDRWNEMQELRKNLK